MSELFVLTERPAVYLASKSARRQELLRQLGVEFESLLLREALGRRRDVVEAPRKDESPIEYVKRVARLKASVGWHRMGRRGLPPKPVLGADTEVVLDGQALGKPADAAGAVAMLAALSGRTHEVLTAVAVRWQAQLVAAVSTSRVTLRAIARDEIERYVATGESFDKAGGYAIQGRAAVFVQHLEGSYSGVMGLPLHETAEILARIGFPVI
ncbi:MAG TPA: Maf family protein [Casimicrobiaceae bacterium]|jgi:septum formation protein|nr:Maf family protein [Casimicrobiaceae bacterium]